MVKYSLSFVEGDNVEIVDAFRGIYNLKQIDKITMNFEDEGELKKYLLKANNIFESDINRSIEIVYSYKGQKQLPVLYSGMAKYFDHYYLRSKLLVLGKSDMSFLDELTDYYNNHYAIGFNPQYQNISDINYYLSGVRKNYIVAADSEFLDNALRNLFEKAAFKIGGNTGEPVENYKEFRDLAFFIYNYEMSKKKETTDVKTASDPEVNDSKLNLMNKVIEATRVYTQLTFDGYEEPLDKKKVKKIKRWK